MTGQEHMEWCKKRALEYIERGDVKQAVQSMFSDLTKHEETKDHIGIKLGVMLMVGGNLSTVYQAKEFIEGFN